MCHICSRVLVTMLLHSMEHQKKETLSLLPKIDLELSRFDSYLIQGFYLLIYICLTLVSCLSCHSLVDKYWLSTDFEWIFLGILKVNIAKQHADWNGWWLKKDAHCKSTKIILKEVMLLKNGLWGIYNYFKNEIKNWILYNSIKTRRKEARDFP